LELNLILKFAYYNVFASLNCSSYFKN